MPTTGRQLMNEAKESIEFWKEKAALLEGVIAERDAEIAEQAEPNDGYYQEKIDNAVKRIKLLEGEIEKLIERNKNERVCRQVADRAWRQAMSDLADSRAYADKLAEGLPCLPKDVDVLREANAKLAEDNERLRDALETYGSHLSDGKIHCDCLKHSDLACSCGLYEALASAGD